MATKWLSWTSTLLLLMTVSVRASDREATSSTATEKEVSTEISLSAQECYEQLISGRTFTLDERTAIERIVRSKASKEPNELRWKISLAILGRQGGNPSESLKTFQKLATEFPKSAEVANQLGQGYMATITGDMGILKMADIAGEARDAWERAIKIDPNHIMARYSLAQYQIQARKQGGWLFGSYSKARQHGDFLVKLKDGSGAFWGHLTLASLAAAEEDWAVMARHFADAKSKALSPPLERMVLVMHGNALIQDKKDAAAALPLLDQAVSAAETDDTGLFYLRGSARRETGDCRGAVEDFLRVLAKNPDAQNTRILIALCYESLRDPAAALTHYREYAARFPKGQRISEAQSAIKRLQRG